MEKYRNKINMKDLFNAFLYFTATYIMDGKLIKLKNISYIVEEALEKDTELLQVGA